MTTHPAYSKPVHDGNVDDSSRKEAAERCDEQQRDNGIRYSIMALYSEQKRSDRGIIPAYKKQPSDLARKSPNKVWLTTQEHRPESRQQPPVFSPSVKHTDDQWDVILIHSNRWDIDRALEGEIEAHSLRLFVDLVLHELLHLVV